MDFPEAVFEKLAGTTRPRDVEAQMGLVIPVRGGGEVHALHPPAFGDPRGVGLGVLQSEAESDRLSAKAGMGTPAPPEPPG